LDQCFVVDSPGVVVGTSFPYAGPFNATTINGQPLCRVVTPFSGNTEFKLNGIYPLPAGFTVSAAFVNVPSGGAGAATVHSGIEANYPAPNRIIAPSLGRNLAACGAAAVCNATALVPLIMPQATFGERRTQLDLRLTRTFALTSRARLNANLDIYNVFNASTIIASNGTYGPQWRAPGATLGVGSPVLPARLFQLSANLSF
jgi:hypothetical protein